MPVMDSQRPPSHQSTQHAPPRYPNTTPQHLPPPNAPQMPHHLAHVVNPPYTLTPPPPHPMAVSPMPLSVPVPVAHPNHHTLHHQTPHPIHPQPPTSISEHSTINTATNSTQQNPQTQSQQHDPLQQSISHTTHLSHHTQQHPNQHHPHLPPPLTPQHPSHNPHHPLPSIQHHPHTHPTIHHTTPPPPPPPHAHYSSYYDTFSSAKIARLESELEKARLEIERLRARLSEYEKERAKTESPKLQSRYWTPSEHKRFLEALQKFGPKDVRAIANFVGSRNATQVRTHAQKYFLRVAREAKAGNALQATRKRSMSESDLARVGRAVNTPPGSPMREKQLSSQPPPPPLIPSVNTDTTMTPVSQESDTNHSLLPPAQVQTTNVVKQESQLPSLSKPPPFANSTLHLSPKRDVTMVSATKPPTSSGVTGGKPPVASSKLSDNTGINLLSLVASERKMETEKTAPR